MRGVALAAVAGRLAAVSGRVSSQGQYHSGDPAYRVSNGIVHLLGSLNQPSGTNAQFAVLPPAARPTHFLWIPTYTSDGTFGWVTINPSGSIFAVNFAGNAAARLYTSLATISYPVSS